MDQQSVSFNIIALCDLIQLPVNAAVFGSQGSACSPADRLIRGWFTPVTPAEYISLDGRMESSTPGQLPNA